MKKTYLDILQLIYEVCLVPDANVFLCRRFMFMFIFRFIELINMFRRCLNIFACIHADGTRWWYLKCLDHRNLRAISLPVHVRRIKRTEDITFTANWRIPTMTERVRPHSTITEY
ncbi:hypothetical protein CBL_13429 [Carabus blaptoides fortunei]